MLLLFIFKNKNKNKNRNKNTNKKTRKKQKQKDFLLLFGNSIDNQIIYFYCWFDQRTFITENIL
jgi:hypothetical protein